MVRIREMENKKDFEDVVDTHYMMGYKLEKYTDNEFTFKKTKTSKLILHLAIILLCWTIGLIILKELLYIGYLNGLYTIHGYYGYMEISLFILLIILITVNWNPISAAYNGEKIIIRWDMKKSKFCSECGNKVVDSQIFCNKCGKKLTNSKKNNIYKEKINKNDKQELKDNTHQEFGKNGSDINNEL